MLNSVISWSRLGRTQASGVAELEVRTNSRQQRVVPTSVRNFAGLLVATWLIALNVRPLLNQLVYTLRLVLS